MKIASSPTIEGLEAMLNKYFYSTSYKIDANLIVTNNKGVYDGIIISHKKGRYIASHK